MSIFAVRFGFALAVVALVLGGRPAHAQSAPVTYWTPGWIGFGGNLNAGEGTKADGDFRGFASTRTNFQNGWFVGSERGGMGLSGINQAGAFGSRYSESVQFGYNFKNAPVSFYAGFDSLKYNSGIGSAFSPFDFDDQHAGLWRACGSRIQTDVESQPVARRRLPAVRAHRHRHAVALAVERFAVRPRSRAPLDRCTFSAMQTVRTGPAERREAAPPLHRAPGPPACCRWRWRISRRDRSRARPR